MNDTKHPLVLVSGAMSMTSCWVYQLQGFSQDRPVLVPSRHYGLHSIAQMAETIAAEAPETFDLVGWSMGGYIAFELYKLAPRRIRKLVLVSTSARPETEEARQVRRTTIQAIETEGLAAVWERTFATAVVEVESIPAEVKERLRADSLALGAETYRSQATAMMGRRDACPMLASITCPTLVLTGEFDTVILPGRSKEIASLVPRCRLEIIRGTGHSPPLEVPDLFNELLREFIDE
jgi:pimeloyl-ACP methyl ester carboxylesterase